LISNDYDVVIVDNLVNSKREAVRRIERIVGHPVPFYEIDACDGASLAKVFDTHEFGGAIHFAALSIAQFRSPKWFVVRRGKPQR